MVCGFPLKAGQRWSRKPIQMKSVAGACYDSFHAKYQVQLLAGLHDGEGWQAKPDGVVHMTYFKNHGATPGSAGVLPAVGDTTTCPLQYTLRVARPVSIRPADETPLGEGWFFLISLKRP